jgi:hypothetical protein
VRALASTLDQRDERISGRRSAAAELILTSVTRLDPADPNNKHDTRESQRQLRQLLMAWDPIGVAGIPGAEDEYDCMISPLMHQLYAGADESSVAQWLVAELNDYFGLTASPDRERQMAARITRWWSARSEELSNQ